ncbi:hypothetical protein [Desulforamulus aeronauticus]|uniref:Uncharacterized protein n=1 Tax=Desulforamulus aeronauticus DSM 10349 TaxID=1121421 RepID=A0A1M6X5X8_9FIRM|nr:hypothetical protein [Desulforamulus aeronauticus]SHL01259.1 hypothetical protein SAMN02745123_03913 [Desulforamulus aeronauticus DSM 10349]
MKQRLTFKTRLPIIALLLFTVSLAFLAPMAKDYYDQYQYQKYLESNAVDHAAHHQ